MPLTLVIGPANAEKAGRVLGAFREALAQGREPLLVVPTLADVEHYRRELASSGAVFGVQVMRFAWLTREIARRAGVGGRPVRGLVRERVVATAVAGAELGPLAASAATPGFAGALLELLDELGDVPATPQRAVSALRSWGEARPDRTAYAADVAALVSAYHRELDRLGVRDERGHAAAAIDALRLAPASWGDAPVFVYGFDDLTPLQRDALRALSRDAGAQVTVSLTYELGRQVFADRATNFEEMRGMADAREEMPARADFYAEASRTALHHLERGLYEDAEPVEAGAAIALLEAGGPRAEIELVGAHVARLLRDGWPAEEIAVVFRDPAAVAPLVAHVFGAYGIPAAIDRRVPAAATALGRGLLALLRASSPAGTADDLLAYLRTPGVVRQLERVDRLEAHVRSEGLRTAAQARAAFEERNEWTLDALDRVARAAQGPPARLCRRLATEAQVLLERPHRGAARVLDADESIDAGAAAQIRTALAELGALAERDPRLAGSPEDLARVLESLTVRLGPSPGPGLVSVSGPLAVRARRVRALFACGLQDGVWPRQTRPRLLLTDEDRRELALASGLALRRHEDPVDAERFLFYATVSRPEELLALSWRVADDEGEDAPRSQFVDDVLTLFRPSLQEASERRALGAVGWPDGLAPTPREARRAAALAGERVRPAAAGGG
ncbi:MAG TPA: hypothetical protein VHB30_05450, partial [Solirubrobacteraceae bacterium]|nr:hypothetical protein [Solirubrobacteraceae bacterium]